jgi:adenylate cyclase
MRCGACGFENPEGFKFCGSCGAGLGNVCPTCGAEVPTGFAFCGVCGTEMASSTEPVPEARDMPSERRRVTVLFADLVGFSTLAEHMDPEELRALMTETFEELTALVEDREGTVEKFIGDAIVAIFGAPIAHEDDPERAVAVALDMIAAIERRSKDKPSPLQLRIGINTGLVVSGAVGDGSQTGVMGDAVNVAARLQQSASPGELLVAEPVYRRLRDRYESVPAGELEVKGRQNPVSAYRIMGSPTASQRRQAPFVGRMEELSLLELLWSSAAKGNTHIVSVVGEPGVGKSRLLSEFAPRTHALDVRIQCGPERAFGPFLELIERVLGGAPEDLSDLKHRAAAIGVDEETAQLVGAFLGVAGAPPVVRMADEQQKRQVFTGVWQLLVSAPRGEPALIVLEDIHWADIASLDLLGFLLERIGGAPVMIVLAYRPGFEQVERATLRASHTVVRLEPLSPQESVDLCRGFLGVESIPAELERVVVDRAEGNPFFIEELLQALLELGSLVVDDGVALLAKVDLQIPDTVEGTVLARVDRLQPSERNLIQQAAVVGRAFSTSLLEKVADRDGVADSLRELSRSQLLVGQGPDMWMFKHALIQEVVYDTLLLRQRRELHLKVAQALEETVGNDPSSLETLAEHYARGDDSEKARSYAVAAGDLAVEHMGFVGAKSSYETALRLWGEGDEEGRAAVLMKLGRVGMQADPNPAKPVLLEAEALWRKLGDLRQAGVALALLGRVHWVAGESDRARDTLERAIKLLEPHGATAELVVAYVWASTGHMLAGKPELAADVALKGLQIAEDLGLDAERSHLLNTLGVCEVEEAKPGGVDRVREALLLAERVGDSEAIGRGYVNLPSCLELFMESEESAQLCRKGRAIMRGFGAPSFEWFIAANEAHSLLRIGRYSDAEELARQALDEARALSAVPGIINASGALIQIMTFDGRLEEARQMLDEILPLARGVGGAEFLAWILQHEAHLEAARGNLATATQSMMEVFEMLHEIRSSMHALHFAPAVARFLPDRAPALLNELGRYDKHPATRALLIETRAALEHNGELFKQAADLYASLGAVAQELHCRLESGELARAHELVDGFGLGEGPFAVRLRELSGAA